MSGSDCSESGGVEDVPPTTPLTPLQPPSPKTPPINEAGVKSPAHKSPVGVTGVTEVNDEVKQAPAVGTPDRHYRPLERAREKRRLRLAESQRSDVLSAWERERVRLRCVQCNHVITDSDWSQFKSEGWDVEIVTQCISCIDAMIEHDLASTSSLT